MTTYIEKFRVVEIEGVFFPPQDQEILEHRLPHTSRHRTSYSPQPQGEQASCFSCPSRPQTQKATLLQSRVSLPQPE